MLYDVNSTRKLEKKIISPSNPELSLMFKAGTAIFNHVKELNKKDLIILIGPGNNGGDTNSEKILTEDDIYKLELDSFMRLIENKKTQDRIKHTLSTGKPLVN